LIAGPGQVVGEFLGTAGHGLDGLGGVLREGLRHLAEPGAHRFLYARGKVGELVVHVLGLESEGGGEALVGRGDGIGGAVAGRLEPVEQIGAALGQGIDHRIADMAERQRDVLAFLGE
jgi:hypothetical protein